MNNAAILVQARMGSERFPGKVLFPILRKPMLAYLLESLYHTRLGQHVTVVTSNHPADDSIAHFCALHNLHAFRGDLSDVTKRMLDAAESEGLETLVRINGNYPLLDYRLVDRALDLHASRNADLTTNMMARSYPAGQSVEVISVKALGRAYVAMTTAEEREQVTSYFYAHPEKFRMASFVSDTHWGEYSFAVDCSEDTRFIEAILHRLSKPHWEYTVADFMAIAQAVADEAKAKRRGGG